MKSRSETAICRQPKYNWVHNKFPIHYGLFFATLKMRLLKGFFKTEVVFEDKN